MKISWGYNNGILDDLSQVWGCSCGGKMVSLPSEVGNSWDMGHLYFLRSMYRYIYIYVHLRLELGAT